MDLLSLLSLSVYSFIILSIIYMNGRKIKYLFFTHKIFMNIVEFNLFMILIDYLSRVFNGKLGAVNFILNYWFNILLYIFAILPGLYWLIYVNFQVYHDQAKIKKVKLNSVFLVIINGALTIASLFNGWFFYIDEQNVYHRGPYFFVHVLLCYSFLFITVIFILKNRKKIEKYYKTLLAFPIPQFIGSLLQVFIYGLSLNWSCMVISILFVYFDVQDVGLNTDYLTGVFNRRQLDSYLKEKINSGTEENTFSAIMLDVDNFKQINDTLGHITGDDALKSVVKILKSCLKSDDFIARLGGDEFYVILNVYEKEHLEMIVSNIKNAVIQFNHYNKKPYQIHFSMGYDVYDFNLKMDVGEFMKHIDRLMYAQKERNKKSIQ